MKVLYLFILKIAYTCYVKDSEGYTYDLSFLTRRQDWEVQNC